MSEIKYRYAFDNNQNIIDVYKLKKTDNYKSAAWIQYSPQMIGVNKAYGFGDQKIGEWIMENLYDENIGAVRKGFTDKSLYEFQPGLNFQAAMTLNSLGMYDEANKIIQWVHNSRLYDHSDGGWIDWYRSDIDEVAPSEQKFIDTNFYHMAALDKGFKF